MKSKCVQNVPSEQVDQVVMQYKMDRWVLDKKIEKSPGMFDLYFYKD